MVVLQNDVLDNIIKIYVLTFFFQVNTVYIHEQEFYRDMAHNILKLEKWSVICLAMILGDSYYAKHHKKKPRLQ